MFNKQDLLEQRLTISPVLVTFWKIKNVRSAISHGASNEPEVYLEPSQTSTRKLLQK